MKELIRKVLIYGISALVVFGGISLLSGTENVQKLPNLPKFEPKKIDIEAGEYEGLIRLHDKDGRFFCSGAIISNDYLLTAAHCVVTSRYSISKEDIQVKDRDQKFTTKANAVGVDIRADYALLRGDFSKFKKFKVLLHPHQIISTALNANMLAAMGAPIATCGFPLGSKTEMCLALPNMFQFDFKLASQNVPMYPGMSGGPVFNSATGEIIAVNTAVSETISIFSPIIAIFENFGIEVIE
jgi:S1-C subfamily serine protease